MLVEENAEVNVAESAPRVMAEVDVAAVTTSPKRKSFPRVLAFFTGGEAENNSPLVRELRRHVTQSFDRLQFRVTSFFCLGYVQGAKESHLAELLASAVGKREEEAYYVGDVGV